MATCNKSTPPQRLYDRPTNLFVAAFIGSPSMNLYEGVTEVDGDAGSVTIGSQTIAFGRPTLDNSPTLGQYSGQRVIVGIRPEDFEDAAIATDVPPERWIKGDVRLIEALGSDLMVHLRIDAEMVNSGDPDAPSQQLGEGSANAVARFSPRSDVHGNESVEIAVRTDNLHFFDAQTHARIR